MSSVKDSLAEQDQYNVSDSHCILSAFGQARLLFRLCSQHRLKAKRSQYAVLKTGDVCQRELQASRNPLTGSSISLLSHVNYVIQQLKRSAESHASLLQANQSVPYACEC